MNVYSDRVLRHVEINAPALIAGVVDYSVVLREGLPQIDLYDSRGHLAALSGEALTEHVRRRAAALAGRGLTRGDRVVMVANNNEQYLATLLAALLLGLVPCAVAPPPMPSRAESAGVQHLRAAIGVVAPAMVLAAERNAVPHPGVVHYEELSSGTGAEFLPQPAPDPTDLHHIQLTSGSTSAPKAVALSHGSVAHNIATVSASMATVRDTGGLFSWLPMYHDMGLIQVLGALIYGGRVGLMAPLGFLRDPLSWMRNMTHHRSSVTAGPTFAYRAATDSLGRAGGARDGIDLSELRHAYIGAEPISLSTLRTFTESFAPCGLRADALIPSYGMAESVLATTIACDLAPDGPRNFGRVRAVQADTAGTPLVACGKPIDGMRIRIVDSDGAELADGVTGEVQIAGPSLMAGYLGPDGRVVARAREWHETGDRGSVCTGELYVIGRSKEMLIVRGRNLPPYDVERSMSALQRVGPGQAVVFSAPDDGRGREVLVAVIATGSVDPDEHREIRADVLARVREDFGFSLDEVVLVPKTAIPRTTSGKTQRLTLRESYLRGQLSG